MHTRPPLNRRQFSQWCALSACGLGTATMAAPMAKPMETLTLLIPASPGGGWDQTGRSLGQTLVSLGLVGKVTYENVPGKGGTLGLTEFVQRHSQQPNSLLVGGMVMVGAIAMNNPPVTLAQVRPVARLTSDYMALVCTANAGLKTLKDLSNALRKDLQQVVFAGGSAGGVDHMLAAMLVRQLKLDPSQLRYLPTAGGAETMQLLQEGKAQVAISGYSEFKADIDAGRLHALGISSKRGLFNLPSLAEGGVPVDLANWRGAFAGSGISDKAHQALTQMLEQAANSVLWKKVLEEKLWQPSLETGKEFAQTLEIEQSMAQVLVHLLKLKSA